MSIALINATGQTIQISKLAKKKPGLVTEETIYRKKSAFRVFDSTKTDGGIIELNIDPFLNGEITIELAGSVMPGADTTFRGFIGVAFRVQQNEPETYECFYIRPTNGRATNQLRRNHSTQYISQPEHPWHRLRKEAPGEYESYADMVEGEWTSMKIIVNRNHASLYINNAAQPCLVVNDLKLGTVAGGIALWIGPGTDGYFRNLRVKKQK